MDELTKLNKVLEFLDTQDNYWHNKDHVLENADIDTTSNEAYFILRHLTKEGYIDEKEHREETGKRLLGKIEVYSENFYMINYSGRIFIKNGGYITRHQINLRKIQSQNRKDWMLIFGTWIAGFGALALVVWEIYKHYCLHID